MLCRELLERFPEHAPTWHALAMSLIELACYDEAEDALRRALDLVPRFSKPETRDRHTQIALAGLGHLEEARGNVDAAREWFSKGHRTYEADAGCLIYLANTWSKIGELDRAEEILRQAILCPEGAIDEALDNLGCIHLAREEFTEARACFVRALEIDPDDERTKDLLEEVDALIAREG